MNCDSLTLTGTPPNQVLTCNIGSAPPGGCSIQGSTNGVIGTPVTLTAVCSSGTTPFTYNWSGGSAGNCGNTQACSVSDSSTTTYSVAISNAQGAFTPSPTKQITWTNTPVAPGGCAITATPTSLPVGGGSVSLSMDCSQGSGLAYSWTGGFAAGANTQSVSGNLTATTTFSATASNAGGSVTKSTSVTVATGGGGGGPISCSGFLGTAVLTANWPLTQNGTVPMGSLDAGVIKFTTGSATGNGSITLSNAGNNAATKHDFVLAAQPCDFQGIKQFLGTGAPTIRFNVSNTPGNGATLLTNTTYYINIRNSEVSGCVANNDMPGCPIFPVNLSGPQ